MTKEYKIRVSLKGDIPQSLRMNAEFMSAALEYLPVEGLVSEDGETRIVKLPGCQGKGSIGDDVVYDVGNVIFLLWFGYGLPVEADKIFSVEIIKE